MSDQNSMDEILKQEKDSLLKNIDKVSSSDLSMVDEPMFKTVDLNNPEGLSIEKTAMLKEAKSQAVEEASMVKVASFNGIAQDPYPSPFLNLSDTQIPQTTSEIFKWCKYFYTFDPLIAGAVNALATFPITEIYLEDKSKTETEKESESCKLYKRIFFKELNIYKLLIEIGVDYYLYGNCFVFGEMWENPTTGEIEWRNMTRLDPSKVVIDYNPVTQEKKFKWQVSARIVDIVRKKKPAEEYRKIPDIIKKAAIEKGVITLNSNNIYHFSRPTDSMGDNNVWGTPVIANVLKLLMYRNILRQAQEAIAREHIVPFRVYYLDSTQNYNAQIDFNNTASAFAGELMKATRDPNHKVVSPVPVNVLNIGGDGRALLLAPEIEQVQAEILAGMNVPREFIFGGVSYSGSSISLKILENNFITYRLLLKDFMQNFIIRNMAKARKEWVSEKDNDSLISVKMIELKMQDDVQQKQLIIDLNIRGKCTDDYMWKVVGIDPEKMRASMKKEALDAIDRDKEIQIAQLRAQLEIKKVEMEINSELQKHAATFATPPVDPTGIASNAPDGMQPAGNAPSAPVEEQQNEEDDSGKIQGVAVKLMKMDAPQQDQFLSSLPEILRQKIQQEMDKLKSVKDSANGENIDMRPMPEQKPPRRDSLKS